MVNIFLVVLLPIDGLGIQLVDSDSVEVMRLSGKAFRMSRSAPDSAFVLARRAQILAEARNRSFGLSVAFNTIGILHKNAAQYDSALIYYKQAVDIRRNLGLKKHEASVLMNVGLVNRRLGLYVQSINSYLAALEIQENLKDTLNVARSLENLAVIWDLQGDTRASEDYNRRAKKFYSIKNDYNGLGRVENNLGIINRSRGNILNYQRIGLIFATSMI